MKWVLWSKTPESGKLLFAALKSLSHFNSSDIVVYIKPTLFRLWSAEPNRDVMNCNGPFTYTTLGMWVAMLVLHSSNALSYQLIFEVGVQKLEKLN